MSVDLKVDGVMVLTGVIVGTGIFLYSKRGAVLDTVTTKLNPASSQNLIYDSLGGNDPDSAVTSAADVIFGTFDQVFGIER